MLMPRNKPRSGSSPGPSRNLSQSIDESIGFLVCDTARYIKRGLYARIGPHGIRGGSWFFLRVLWQGDGITQRELSQRLGLMEPSVLEMLRIMEKDGLVRRERSATDRRKVHIYLTDRARTLEPKLMGIAGAVNTMMLGSMTQAEEVLLKLLLKRLRDTIGTDFAALAAELTNGVKSIAMSADRHDEGVIAVPKVRPLKKRAHLSRAKKAQHRPRTV